MGKIVVEYNSNNSGGSWWLEEKDWDALKAAGWKLFSGDEFAYKDGEYIPDENGLPSKKDEVDEADRDKENYSFGWDVPRYAFKRFNSIQEAIKEFEKLTGQDVTDEGCNCCGAPHSFTWGKDIIERVPVDEQDYNFASGEELLEYMYPDKNTGLSKRELLERQK